LLGAVSLLNDFASEMIYPLLPAFVTGVLGGGAAALGTLDGAAEFAAAFVKFGAGRLADRTRRRGPLIVAGYAIAVLVRPVIAATDYMRAFAEQIRSFVPRRYAVLGTDGFGRSDTREKLRRFFEVDRYYVTVAALKALADDGALPTAKVAEAIKKYGIDASKPAPWTV